jgi:hypothetical protein
MNEGTLLKITAIVSLTILEALNIIFLRVDGAILSAVVGAIAGLAGYHIGRARGEKGGV